MIVRGAFNDALAPGARKWFVDEYEQLPAEYPGLFNILTSSRAYEDDKFSTGLGVATAKPEGEEIDMDRPEFLGSVRATHLSYGLGYEITRESVEDDLYGVFQKNGSRNLARSLRETEETVAWGVINNGFDTTTTHDSQYLFDTDHPVRGGTDLSNKATADLSVSSLQLALENFWTLKNDRNLRIKVTPETLWVPTGLIWTAEEILGSEYKPFTANNEINVVRRQGIVPKMSRYLTDADGWFLFAKKNQNGLNFYWRRKPAMEDDFVKRRQVSQHFIHSRFSVVANDWHGAYGSTGA